LDSFRYVVVDGVRRRSQDGSGGTSGQAAMKLTEMADGPARTADGRVRGRAIEDVER
jgi:hypothetical protein